MIGFACILGLYVLIWFILSPNKEKITVKKKRLGMLDSSKLHLLFRDK